MAQNTSSATHPLGQRQVAEVEQLQRLFLVLERVVVRPRARSCARPPVGLEQVLHHAAARRRASLSGALPTSNSPTPRMSTTSIEWWATTARPDSVTMVGCGDAGRVADLLQREHDVVRVLLHRVVHRRREVGLRAVVVDAQPAAHVEVLERRAQLAQLDVEAPRLAQRVLDRADGRDLAAQVEVQQLEAVRAGRWRAGS